MDRDTPSFVGSDGGDPITAAMQNTSNAEGGALAVGPARGDTVKPAGLGEARLAAHRGDSTFHG